VNLGAAFFGGEDGKSFAALFDANVAARTLWLAHNKQQRPYLL
jgi:hypothetical protein